MSKKCYKQGGAQTKETCNCEDFRLGAKTIVTTLSAKNLIIIIAAIIANPSCAYAEADSLESMPQNSIQEEKHDEYSDFSFASILVNEPAKSNRNNAFLAIDKNGRPALYPALRSQRCAELSQHTLTDVLAHWCPTDASGDVYSFTFYRWFDANWNAIKVEMRFKDNYCSHFRVESADSAVKTWLPTNAIPSEVDKPNPGPKLKLPIFVGLVEGPRDMSDCGIGGISDEWKKLLKEGKCPLGSAK